MTKESKDFPSAVEYLTNLVKGGEEPDVIINTAKVFHDLGQLRQKTAKAILGSLGIKTETSDDLDD